MIGAALLLALAITSSLVVADRKATTTPGGSTVGPFAEVPTKLPAGFLGHSAAKLFSSAAAKKGEFESTEDYHRRRTSSIRPGFYVFVWKEQVPVYDADTETFTFRLATANGRHLLPMGEGFSALVIRTVSDELAQEAHAVGLVLVVDFQQIADRQHADEIPFLHDRQMPASDSVHLLERGVDRLAGIGDDDVLRHDIRDDRLVGIEPLGYDARHHVAFGEDADEAPRLEHSDRADILLRHAPGHVAH